MFEWPRRLLARLSDAAHASALPDPKRESKRPQSSNRGRVRCVYPDCPDAGSLSRPRRRPLSRGSSPSGHPAEPLVSYQINRQFSGWILPPQVIRAGCKPAKCWAISSGGLRRGFPNQEGDKERCAREDPGKKATATVRLHL